MSNSAWADIIFFGGDIVTIDHSRPLAEALAVGNGRIMEVGDRNEVFQLNGPQTRFVDLGGRTLIPGLIEPHTHILLSALVYDWIDVSGFSNASGAEVLDKLHKAAAEVKPGEWIKAFGYDPILTRDLKGLNADLLDQISITNPVFLQIQPMHTAYVNHKALEVVGITKDTPQPVDGQFVKDEAGNPTGVLIEQGGILPFTAAIVRNSASNARELINNQMGRYARAGYTTIGVMGDFPFFPHAYPTLRQLAEADGSPLRMVLLDKVTDFERGLDTVGGPATGRFKSIGVKLWYDGSPYSGNMFLDHDYLNSQLMQEGLSVPKGTRGYAMIPKETLHQLVKKYHDRGMQISIHAQGDRAIREVIDVFEEVIRASPRDDHRHRLEHCALFPADQLERAARLGLTPSWHINHIYYYGEALRDEIIGADRAARMMPVADANRHGLRGSLHNDSPMYPAEPFKLMRTAVTRKTRNNQVIGADQAISAWGALKALTINAAWQLFLEDQLGSLERGKVADLVVLSENPLKTDPDHLDRIRVVETYSDGRRMDLDNNY